MDAQVVEAMAPYHVAEFYNPSALYCAAKAVRQQLEASRGAVAEVIGVKAADIIFTAGGTEANNMAILGVAQSFPGSHIVTTALEHDSVLAPINFLATQGWSKTEVQPAPSGVMDAQAVAAAITDQTVLVSVMYANNEIGTIQPIREIAQVIKTKIKYRKQQNNTRPLYFHTDAAQAANYLDLHVHRLGVDMMTLNGGKIYGPKQSGVLYAAAHVRLTPIIHGGGQEKGRRSGTENVAGIIGFTAALQQADRLRKSEAIRLKRLQTVFFEQLKNHIPQATINGSAKLRLPNNIHITIPGADNERLVFGLDGAGIQCATGSACSASKTESSHALKALGLSDAAARASLRFTMGRETTINHVEQTVRLLAKIVA